MKWGAAKQVILHEDGLEGQNEERGGQIPGKEAKQKGLHWHVINWPQGNSMKKSAKVF